MKYLLVLLLILTACSSVNSVVSRLPDTPKIDNIVIPTGGTDEGSTINDLKKQKLEAEKNAKMWQAKAELYGIGIKDERAAANAAWIRAACIWAVSICGLLFAVCLFFRLWLGSLGGLTNAGLVTFGILGALAGVILVFQTLLLWLVLGCIVLTIVIGLIVVLRKVLQWKQATAAASNMAENLLGSISSVRLPKNISVEAEEALLQYKKRFEEYFNSVKATAHVDQVKKKVHTLVQEARGKKVKKP
jgi:hypothetical protein